MKTCICGRTEIMWNTHKVGVTADNIVRYTVSSLTVLHTLCSHFAKYYCVNCCVVNFGLARDSFPESLFQHSFSF